MYQYPILNNIPQWIMCPLCHEYMTKYKTYFLKHFNKCEDYDDHIDDIESYNIDENTTIGEYIEQKVNCIETTKKLIKTHELQDITTYNDIKLYIRNKILENITYYLHINTDIIHIYQFFFGKTEESSNDYTNEMVKYIESR